MNRRDFIKLMLASGITTIPPSVFSSSSTEEYNGPFYISIAAKGGWDPTSFCDPKVNIPGELEINHWSRTKDIQTAGNIRFAPFANNEIFFQRFHQHMLVINGIDSQTNSHEAGVIHTWSGRLAPGFPSFSALVSAIYGRDLPIPYISSGSYQETAGLVRYSLVRNPDTLRTMLLPNNLENNQDRNYFYQSDLDTLRHFQQERTLALMEMPNLLPRENQSLSQLYMARNSMLKLKAFANNLPKEFVKDDQSSPRSSIKQQAQLALTSYISGMTVSCDLMLASFDTHENHDDKQSLMLKKLTDGISFLFDYAGELGISDKLIVLVTSDFGRTPYYNDDNGKDHWPIGSALIMKENANWGNKVVGLTDEGHNAYPINPTTLNIDLMSGTIIYPKHIHDAMRHLAGINNSDITNKFNLNVNEAFDFFNGSI